MALLERLDECVAYVSVNPQFREAAIFAQQFMALQAQGLAVVVEHFKATLREITAKVLPEVQRAVADPDEEDAENNRLKRELAPAGDPPKLDYGGCGEGLAADLSTIGLSARR